MGTIAGTRWSYFNVLEALLANVAPGPYNADVGAWSKAIWKLREEYEGRYPELFAQIHFTERDPGPPYSSQVSDFFVYQAFGGVKQVMNPAYERMEISEEAQKELQKRNRALLERYEKVLPEMAKILANELKLTNPDSDLDPQRSSWETHRKKI